MNKELPSSWMSQFLIVLLLISIGVMLIPTAIFAPEYIWEYVYPPEGPQPITTPLLSMTLPMLFLSILLLVFGYQRAKQFIAFNKE